ncbi:6143_t:CDS:2, partial [Dentiscutata heterogama]
AIKWIKIAWSEVLAKTIKRYWFHTKIVFPHNENEIPVVLLLLLKQIDILNLCNLLPIEDLLNLDEEQE